MSPALIGTLRGLVLAIALGAIGAALTFLTTDDISKAWWAPVVVLLLRAGEGFLDKRRGQAPQAGVFSPRPVDPAAYLPPGGTIGPVGPPEDGQVLVVTVVGVTGLLATVLAAVILLGLLWEWAPLL